MAYYLFDRCTQENLGEIEVSVKELGLKDYRLYENVDISQYIRAWTGDIFGDDTKNTFCLLYNEYNRTPLILQTENSVSHNDSGISEANKEIN